MVRIVLFSIFAKNKINMELTINQIKEKNRQLEIDIEKLLDKHYEETRVSVILHAGFGWTDTKYCYSIGIQFDNPFYKV